MLQLAWKVVIFLKLEPNLFEYFKNAGQTIKYQSGEIIYMQEEVADNLYLITKGRVRVYDISIHGKELTIEILDKGQLFGESSFYQNSCRPAAVEAVTDVELITCRLEGLFPYLMKSQELTVFLLRMMNDRCNHLTKLLKWSYSYNRFEKVAALLYDLVENGTPEKGIIDNTLPYSHEDVAQSTGLSRVNVTKILKQFESEGFIEIQYRRIKVINSEGLYTKYLIEK